MLHSVADCKVSTVFSSGNISSDLSTYAVQNHPFFCFFVFCFFFCKMFFVFFLHTICLKMYFKLTKDNITFKQPGHCCRVWCFYSSVVILNIKQIESY